MSSAPQPHPCHANAARVGATQSHRPLHYPPGPRLPCRAQLRMPPHSGAQAKAHSGLLSGSEHIHKDTRVREELSILPTATAFASPAGWLACALHRDTQSQQLRSFCTLQKTAPQLVHEPVCAHGAVQQRRVTHTAGYGNGCYR